MTKLAIVIWLLLVPTVLSAAEIKGTILKFDRAENRVVLRTERGEETFLTTKETKGIENAKEGANVMVTFSEKDGQPKVSEIALEN
jgi:Cu/Ag efflux protein CusF